MVVVVTDGVFSWIFSLKEIGMHFLCKGDAWITYTKCFATLHILIFPLNTYTVGNANIFHLENLSLRRSIINLKPFIVIFKSSSNKCNILFIGLARGNEDITEPCLHSAHWPEAALFWWCYLSLFISALQMEYSDECRLEGLSSQ